MAALALPLVGGLAGMLVSKTVLKSKAPAAAPVQPVVQRRANTSVADALSARRGSRDNRRTGAMGAEASGGLKSKLGT